MRFYSRVANVLGISCVFAAAVAPLSSVADSAPSAVYVPVGGASCVSRGSDVTVQGLELQGQALSELVSVLRNPGLASGTSRVAELMARGMLPQVDGASLALPPPPPPSRNLSYSQALLWIFSSLA